MSRTPDKIIKYDLATKVETEIPIEGLVNKVALKDKMSTKEIQQLLKDRSTF